MSIAFRPLLDRFTRPLRFGLVGTSGIVVNSIALWILVQRAHMAIPIASVIATEAAICSNFLLNDRWTFRASAQPRSAAQRLLRFNGVALGGMAITTAALMLLTTYAQLDLIAANILAVGGATSWNYVASNRWAWGSSQGSGIRKQASLRQEATEWLFLPDRDEEIGL